MRRDLVLFILIVLGLHCFGHAEAKHQTGRISQEYVEVVDPEDWSAVRSTITSADAAAMPISHAAESRIRFKSAPQHRRFAIRVRDPGRRDGARKATRPAFDANL